MKKVFLTLVFSIVMFACGVGLVYVGNKPNSDSFASVASSQDVFKAHLPEHFITVQQGIGPNIHHRVDGFAQNIREMQNVNIEVEIPSHIDYVPVTVISANAFTELPATALNRGNIVSLVIPDTVTTIGNSAFRNNRIGGNLVIPNSVTALGQNTFQDNYIANLTLPNNPNFNAIASNVFNNNLISSVVIPNSVNSIGQGAFVDNPLTKVILPDNPGFTTIPNFSFGHNVARAGVLENVIIPNSVVTIGQGAFQNNRLVSIEIPNSVTTIYATAFFNNNLDHIVIPDSVTRIMANVFNGNNLLTAIIPSSVQTLGTNAFANNPDLRIFTELETPPADWTGWNPGNRPVAWGSVMHPNITVTNVGGTAISPQQVNLAGNLSLTLENPNGIGQIVINGHSLDALTGTLPNNAASWSHSPFWIGTELQATVNLDLTFIGHHLKIEVFYPTFEITTAVNPAGNYAGSVASTGTYLNLDKLVHNSTRQLIATANSGWRFTHWTASAGVVIESYNSKTTNVTISTADATVTAHFQAYVTVNDIQTDITEQVYNVGHLAPATPPEHHVFIGWALYGTTEILAGTFAFIPGARFIPLLQGYVTVNGTQILISEQVYNIGHLAIPTVLEGYTFIGWRLTGEEETLDNDSKLVPGMQIVSVIEEIVTNDNDFPWIYIIIGGAILLGISLLIIVLLLLRKKRTNQ